MKPDTIVLIHGFWVTPLSWEGWKAHYEAQGYRVLTPGYPGFEVGVEALNSDPTPIERLTVPDIIASLEAVLRELDRPPIIMGHSAGGAFAQILLDHGFGAAGVALNSAPTEGVKVTPPAQLKASFPVLRHPFDRERATGLSPEQWRYAFTNTFPEEESLALYRRYHVPAAAAIFWGSLLANVQPGRQDTWVDYRNDARAPLLFISGGEDHLMPPAVQRSNVAHYTPNAVTELREYPGYAHLLPAQQGSERIADEALAWALEHAR
ncbi:alpha/beta hydrolase [Micromonospora sp. NPDC047707]|uniref:alpha/beta hydrolase n=1 Tax=Micromonospora sp. NPDC047707 TaxID=3154498 RepID=UPI0034550B3B